ncbi:MAG TPA: LPS export ABC transporter ATP-binding protein [Planctomycetota bacterium]|nr:LPS export ABC transporter ATP-binding protein [Planctomycetota bacterium]HRT96184.1 LPS export ABC transporter ATP-binding protein [Planctomycetota bacterium]
MPLLHCEDLVKTYGGRRVVDKASFEVETGEIVGLLGPNGAGKTTSFRMTIGMIHPNEGKVVFRGQEITRLPMYRRARLGMGYLSQEPSLFQRLTARNNLLAILETLPLSRADRLRRLDQLLQDFDLVKVAGNMAGNLSGGERRRLEIARALITNPQVFLLDEPFSGIDPKKITDIQNIIRQLRSKGMSILLTDHNVRDTLRVTDRAYIIDQGRILAHGSPEEIVEHPDVKQRYLGHEFTL